MGEVAENGEPEGGERVPEEAVAEEGQVIEPMGRAWLEVAWIGSRKRLGAPVGSGGRDAGERRRSTDPATSQRARRGDPRMEGRENRAQEGGPGWLLRVEDVGSAQRSHSDMPIVIPREDPSLEVGDY